MALVSQELVVYSNSRRDNIVFGKLDASENEVVKAARAANAHEFISIMIGRTTILVAHRLNTIKNLDSITLVADGRVVERC
ncbi:hypothetical protein WN944_000972 [Citrus x changshan-huyou]|uniref:Uncharacterized protein n=1 Tax=Citrus x changshan-huyou TaxID=2935761 RepID=A0AAP0MFJ0_9ROSI